MAQPLSIQTIVDNAKTYEEAARGFNFNYPKPTTAEGNEFTSKVNKRFPTGSTTTSGSNNTGGSAGTIQKLGNIHGYTVGEGLVSSAAAEELISTKDIAQSLESVGRAFNESKNAASAFGKIFTNSMSGLADQAFNMVEKEVALRNKLNGQIGIAGELSRGYRNTIVDASDKVKGMGYSFDELADSAISITQETGRFFTVNEKVLENMAETSRAFVGNIKEMGPIIRNFELVGVGAEKTLENINEAGKRALTLGLNIRTTTEQFQKNIGKVNEYGFKNGVQGLADMVRKATEFRMSMDEAFKVADKVMSPEGAIDLAANLQVLGGAVGALGDPFQMMYMATNNVEGLQDALIDASKSLATYNTEQGRFEITGVNLRRAKQMANDLGISYQELAKGAIAAAERTSAAADIMAAGVKVDDKEKEFITNLARMGKDGKMVIEVPPSLQEQFGKTVALEDLNQDVTNAIVANQEAFEKQNIKDIALNQFTETQKGTLLLSEIAAMLKVEFANTYRGFGAKVDEYIKVGNKAMEDYLAGKSDTLNIKGQLEAERNKFNEKEKDKSGKAKSEPVNPTNVNIKPTEKETTKTPENTPISVADMERIMNNVAFRNEMAIRENKSDTKVNVNSADKRDYVNIDIK